MPIRWMSWADYNEFLCARGKRIIEKEQREREDEFWQTWHSMLHKYGREGMLARLCIFPEQLANERAKREKSTS